MKGNGLIAAALALVIAWAVMLLALFIVIVVTGRPL